MDIHNLISSLNENNVKYAKYVTFDIFILSDITDPSFDIKTFKHEVKTIYSGLDFIAYIQDDIIPDEVKVSIIKAIHLGKYWKHLIPYLDVSQYNDILTVDYIDTILIQQQEITTALIKIRKVYDDRTISYWKDKQKITRFTRVFKPEAKKIYLKISINESMWQLYRIANNLPSFNEFAKQIVSPKTRQNILNNKYNSVSKYYVKALYYLLSTEIEQYKYKQICLNYDYVIFEVDEFIDYKYDSEIYTYLKIE